MCETYSAQQIVNVQCKANVIFSITLTALPNTHSVPHGLITHFSNMAHIPHHQGEKKPHGIKSRVMHTELKTSIILKFLVFCY